MVGSERLARMILALAVALPALTAPSPGFAYGRPAAPAGQPGAPAGPGFVNSGQALAGETGNGVALGDLDGDGDVDAAVANDYEASEGGALHLWLNDGDGVFASGPVLGIGTADLYAVALGDLDGDDDLDAITTGLPPSLAAASGPEAPTGTSGANRVWVNQGGDQGGTEGAFAAGDTFGIAAGYGVAVGDVDNDGDLDALVVGNSNQVWLNDGGAVFTAGPAFPFQFSEAVALAHLDGDGYLDAVIADSGSGTNNQVWWNDGNWSPGPGSFTAGQLLPTSSLVQGLAVGQLDSDTQPDIFLAASGPDQVYWNAGSRSFTTTGALPISDSSWAIALADVDADSDLDAVVGNITADPNRLWSNLGGRVFTVTQEFGDELGLYWTRGVGLADLNGDTSADLFEITTAEDRVWLNTGGPPPVIPNQPGWQRQVLDTRGEAGFGSSLALDANGYPHLSYNRLYQDPDETVTYLMYARWDGVRWHSDIVHTQASPGTALALDTSGNPRIAFLTGGGATLNYALWNGAAWQVQTVESVPFPQTLALGGLQVDSGGSPHLVYNTFSNASATPERLKYARWNGTAWQIETVENGLVYDSALALDAAGTPHLGYAIRADFDTYVVKYASRGGAVWQSEVIDGDVADAGVFVASLALDASGNPHLGYVLDNFGGAEIIKYASQGAGGWNTQPLTTLDPGDSVMDLVLGLDGAARPHLVYFLSDTTLEAHRIQYEHWDGSAWQEVTLDSGAETTVFREELVALDLDAAGGLHASYYDPHYEDLRYVTWAPNWQVRTLPETGLVQSLAVAVGSTLEGTLPHIAYYDQSGGQVTLGTWDTDWALNPLDFVSAPVETVSVAAGTQYQHVSYYDADNQRLMYSYWDGAAWHPEVVDEAGDVGRYNAILLGGHNDGAPRIVYWDATTRRIKLARPVLNVGLWDIFPNNAGPALDAGSGRLSAADMPGGRVAVAYHDGANDDLRLAIWNPSTGNWSDELVDGASSEAGQLNSVQVDFTDGTPVVAYLGQGALRWAYQVGGVWQSQAVPGTGGEVVTGLSLELGLGTRQRARIAYTTAGGAAYVAQRRDGAWQIEEVASSGAAAASALSSALDSRLHLAYVRAGTGLHYAFRTANLDVNLSAPAPSSQYGGEYNPLDPCGDLRSSLGGQALLGRTSFGPAAHSALAQLPLGQLGDEAIFAGMDAVFARTAAGQAYVDLYGQHGAEMGQIGLQDPGLLWDAFGTLQNFMPGLEALVTGRGEDVVVTQEMVDDALDIWQRVAAAASPALASAINAELAKYDNLQDFAGLSFDDWARAIGVQPPPAATYLPMLVR